MHAVGVAMKRRCRKRSSAWMLRDRALLAASGGSHMANNVAKVVRTVTSAKQQAHLQLATTVFRKRVALFVVLTAQLLCIE
jgi:hypothetical protein